MLINLLFLFVQTSNNVQKFATDILHMVGCSNASLSLQAVIFYLLCSNQNISNCIAAFLHSDHKQQQQQQQSVKGTIFQHLCHVILHIMDHTHWPHKCQIQINNLTTKDSDLGYNLNSSQYVSILKQTLQKILCDIASVTVQSPYVYFCFV